MNIYGMVIRGKEKNTKGESKRGLVSKYAHRES